MSSATGVALAWRTKWVLLWEPPPGAYRPEDYAYRSAGVPAKPGRYVLETHGVPAVPAKRFTVALGLPIFSADAHELSKITKTFGSHSL
jgi:hypothetical protein